MSTLGLDGAMVFGRTRERPLDHQDFWPIVEAAEALRAPLYLHSQSPPPGVRDSYDSGLGPALDAAFATQGSAGTTRPACGSDGTAERARARQSGSPAAR